MDPLTNAIVPMDAVMKNMKEAFDEAVANGEVEPIQDAQIRVHRSGDDVPAHVVAKRRARNKVARKQRKINAKRSK